MDNLNMLCQTIRFQRTALQNSLAMITAVQKHGERLLKTTLEQSPWIPGESRDACLFWAGIWTKNLTGVTDLVDKNLATMERLTSTGERREARPQKPSREKTAEKPAAEPAEPRQPSVAGKQMAEKKQAAEKPPTEEKEMPPKEGEHTSMQTAMTKAETERALASEPTPEKKPEPPPAKPSEKKKPSEPKT